MVLVVEDEPAIRELLRYALAIVQDVRARSGD